MSWKRIALLCLWSACFGAASEEVGHAYVMPAEQIVQFVASNFSKVQTLTVRRHCRHTGKDGGVIGFDEVLTMRSPDLLHSKIKDVDEKTGAAREHVKKPEWTSLPHGVLHSYQQFFLANSASRLLTLLLEMGIDLQKVGYTRVNEVIAYRVGDAEETSPKFLVEKGRFLPLLISYKTSGLGETPFKARFLDYRKVEQAWYPFEVLCSRPDGTAEQCVVRSLRVNGPVSLSHFGSK